MSQVSSFIIIVLILIVLAAFVLFSLMKRAKNDPESLKNSILDHVNIPDEADEFYDIVEHYTDPRDLVSRSARPKYPDSNDYREWMAVMEEKSKKAQERLEKQSLEDLELW